MIGRSSKTRIVVGAFALGAMLSLSACGTGESSGSAAEKAAAAGEDNGGDRAVHEKFNKYVSALNAMTSYDLSERLSYFEERNPQLKGGGSLTELNVQPLAIEHVLRMLEEGQKLEASIPGVDEKVKALIPALTELNAVAGELNAYANTKEYTVDGGKKARELAPRFVAALKTADPLLVEFATTMQSFERSRDEAALKDVKPDSLEFHKLTVSLTARDALNEFKKIDGPGSDTKAFQASLSKLGTVNSAFNAFLANQPKSGDGAISSWCSSYTGDINTMIGEGRTFVESLAKNSSSLGDDAEDVVEEFNDSVDNLGRCDGR